MVRKRERNAELAEKIEMIADGVLFAERLFHQSSNSSVNSISTGTALL
jgi:hypothetical protein